MEENAREIGMPRSYISDPNRFFSWDVEGICETNVRYRCILHLEGLINWYNFIRY